MGLVGFPSAGSKQPFWSLQRFPAGRQLLADYLLALEIDLQVTIQKRNLHVRPISLCPHPDIVAIGILELRLLRR